MQINEIAVNVEGVWLPRGEQHMLDWMTRGKGARRVGPQKKITYQWGKQETAMGLFRTHVANWNNGCFVDVGGHCGFWSMWWGLECKAGIVAYEPIPVLRRIYEANVRGNGVDWENVSLLPFALSNEPGEMEMKFNPANTGATRILSHKDAATKGITAMIETIDRTLEDSLQGRRMAVLKIDCEGFEEKVVAGAAEAIQKHKPCIVCEQKFENRHFDFEKDGAIRSLEKMGYKTLKEMSGDHIMVPA